MAFDTFDEGISLGGMRSRTEIRTLICYLFKSVGVPMAKDAVVNALMEKGLANYFETSSCFDDLVRTVKERAVECALSLLKQEQIENDNKVTITKTDNGYTVTCSISGGDMELLSFSLYVPDKQQARIIRKNFYKNPDIFYSVMIALLTRNKRSVTEILDELGSVI